VWRCCLGHRATGCRRRVSLCSRSWRAGHLLSKVAVSPSRQLCARPSPRAEGPELGRAHDSSDPVTGTSGSARRNGVTDARQVAQMFADVCGTPTTCTRRRGGWRRCSTRVGSCRRSSTTNRQVSAQVRVSGTPRPPVALESGGRRRGPAAVGCTAQPTASANCRCLLIAPRTIPAGGGDRGLGRDRGDRCGARQHEPVRLGRECDRGRRPWLGPAVGRDRFDRRRARTR